MGAAACEHGADMINRVRGFRHQGYVALIDERQGQVSDAFLGTDQRAYLIRPLEIHVVTTFVPGSHGFSEIVHTRIRRVLVVGRIATRLAKLLNHIVRSGAVGVAHAQVDNIHAFGPYLVPHAVDFLEQIRRQHFQAISRLYCKHGLSLSKHKSVTNPYNVLLGLSSTKFVVTGGNELRMVYSAATGLIKLPIPSTRISIRSPDSIGPTPDGVPVAMTSPGNKVMIDEIKDTRRLTSKIRFRVLDDCFRSPFKYASTVMSDGSRPVSITGPMGQNVSNPLPRVH
jgi:hypothetical protein